MTDQGPRRSAIIAGSGAIAIDQLLFLDSAFGAEKARVLRRELAHGGNIATALAAVGVLGGRPRWLGYLPSGHEFRAVREDLLTYGVDLDGAVPTQAAPIQSTILIDPAGERFIAFDDETELGLPAGISPDVLTDVDVLLLDVYSAANGIPLAEHAVAHGIPVVADLERVDSDAGHELAHVASHLVIPLTLGNEITGETEPDAVLDSLWNTTRQAVVLTDGSRGAWYRAGDESARVPAFTVDVVDTSGCGDVFHGVYALRIGQKRPVGEAVRHAAAAAAIAATSPGGRGHLPTEDDLATLLGDWRA